MSSSLVEVQREGDSRGVAVGAGLLAAGLGMVFMAYDLSLEGWQELAQWHEWVELLALGPGTGLCVFLLVDRARQRTRRARQELDLAGRAHLLHLGRLAAGIAHEVRNPLHNLRLIAERLAAADVALTAEERGRLLDRLAANLDRVEGAADLVYQQARELEHDATGPVELRTLVEEVLADLPGPVQRAIPVDLHVEAPQEALRVILRNLLCNARNADAGVIEISAVVHARRVQLTVRNRGRLDQRTDAHGLGIGLHLCRLLVQRWDAALTVAQEGERVVARLDLPRADPADGEGE